MENRFFELSNATGGLLGRRSDGNRFRSGGQSAALSTNWARSQSAAQRVLVILIENGGVDLRIPEAVDALINSIPGSGLIPDAAKKKIRDLMAAEINKPLKKLSKDLLESVELLGNRYAAAKPGLYGDVVILQNGAATYDELKRRLIASSAAGQLIDLFILTHGDANYIAVTGGIDGKRIGDIRREYGKPLLLRSVYMMNCVGSSLNQAWLDAGAKSVSGTVGDNFLPEPTMFFFWENWKGGQAFETAVNGAYQRTVELLDRAIKSLAGPLAIPGLDVRALQFVKDSKPVVKGQGSVTVSTDDLVFSQSMTSMPSAIRRDVSLPHAMSDAGAPPAGASALSSDGVELIKQFEGFRANLYNDPVGHCTVGYGTLVHRGNCDGSASEQPYLAGVSKDAATQLLAQEVSRTAPAIAQAASSPLNQNQLDALASFVYNIGVGAFLSSTLARLLGQGRYGDVPSELKKWTKSRVNGQLVDLPGLVRRRGAEADLWQRPIPVQGQSLSVSCRGVSLSLDKWDIIAKSVFGYSSYDDYVAKELTSATFFGQTLNQVGPQLADKLHTAEVTLKGKGIASVPTVGSTFRRKGGMHGWGLAIDFNILQDPYVLNEAGEAALDRDLKAAYDHIADFVLGLAGSSLKKLTQGRSAFNGSIGAVYDALRAESDAMKTYFGLMNDPAALTAFLASDWVAVHPGGAPPDRAAAQQQMRNDYETLGGATATGTKLPTSDSKNVDRPFAPKSASGAGDPATGFLNLDRDFVLALTDAGLAWGAIDLGGAAGDIMHFDCRLDGKGKEAFNALVAQR